MQYNQTSLSDTELISHQGPLDHRMPSAVSTLLQSPYIHTFHASPFPSHAGHSVAGDLSFDVGHNTRGQVSGQDESRRTINVQRKV